MKAARNTPARPSPAAVQAAIRAQAPVGASLRVDLWIARRLGRPDLYSGVTVPSERMERQRREIMRQGVADHRVTAATTETWAQAFQRLHGEAL